MRPVHLYFKLPVQPGPAPDLSELRTQRQDRAPPWRYDGCGKETWQMDWLKRMEAALALMESRMTEGVTIEEIAAAACFSPFHFQRAFHFITGMTVAEYMRNRRLTLAAQELVMSDIKVVDVALKYGYDTPESFTKAFRRLHGTTPTEARRSGTVLKAFPPITFQLSLKGDTPMDYRMVDRESFTVVGKGLRTSAKVGQNLRDIPEFWERSMKDGTTDQVAALAPDKPMLGVCTDFTLGSDEFLYLIAVEAPADKADAAAGLVARDIPANTWAVFTSSMQDIQPTWQRIFQEWFPATGYEHAHGPELEVYVEEGGTMKCEIWIPVVKK